MEKPRLSFWQIWNMSFGFLGIQFGFALQNANISRIFETLGASIDAIPILWMAAPLTGLLVQPIIGYMSDHTWGRLGRAKDLFFNWCRPGLHRFIIYAKLPRALGGRGLVVGAGCLHQYIHGTFPRPGGRHAAI